MLGAVHGLVGLGQKRIGRAGVVRVEGNAHAAGGADGLPGDGDRFGYGSADTFKAADDHAFAIGHLFAGAIQPGLPFLDQNHSKLVAAKAHENILRADTGLIRLASVFST